MPRSRPASNPLSYHKHTGQYYVTRDAKRIYLGADQEQALDKYHRLALGIAVQEKPQRIRGLTFRELANRFIMSQQANWQNVQTTLRSYKDWLGRFLKDHSGLMAEDVTVEMFAAWKVSLRSRKYSPESINHYLTAVRSVYYFAEEIGLIQKAPRLKRVKNEPRRIVGSKEKPIYMIDDITALLEYADLQIRAMILLALNCGFGPKDLRDLKWTNISNARVTLPRSKTGICQTFLLWAETLEALAKLKEYRKTLVVRMAERGRERSDHGHVFVTRFWRPWGKDAVAEQFRKLCRKAKVPCHGFYRLRHCASTAMALVTTPHVQRKFLRHSQLQQQVAYSHTPDSAVDDAITSSSPCRVKT